MKPFIAILILCFGCLLSNAQEQFGNYITNFQYAMVMYREPVVSTVTDGQTEYTFTNIVRRPAIKIGWCVSKWDGTNIMVRKLNIEILSSKDLIHWEHEKTLSPTLFYLPTIVSEKTVWWHPWYDFDWKTDDCKFYKAELVNVEYGTMELGEHHWP